LKADYTVANLQQFGQKLDATIAKASELIERLDRGPIDVRAYCRRGDRHR
jgi:hypothetical protein